MPTRAKSSVPSPTLQPLANSRLVALLGELAQGEGFSPSLLPGVRFMRSTLHIPRSPIAYDPGICIIGQGRKLGHLNGDVFRYDPANYLVLTLPIPFECETIGSPAEPLLGLFIDVTPAVIAELAVQMTPLTFAAHSTPHAVSTAVLGTDLADSAVRLLECLRSPDEARVLGAQRVREIVYRVLLGPLGGNLRALAAPHSHFGQIGRVLHRLHTQFARNVDVNSLAHEAGMSASTFHAHFKAITAASPLQYLKSLRLHKARMLMVHEGLNAGTAAHQVGYESVSQFSREFKRLFGESPSTSASTLRRALVRLA